MPVRGAISFVIGLLVFSLLAAASCERPRNSVAQERAPGALDNAPASEAKPSEAHAATKAAQGRGPIPTSVAGAFYPADPKTLSSLIRSYVADAKYLGLKNAWAAIAPHAGYRYSGPIAGSAYRQFEGRDIKLVVLLAFVHRPVDSLGRLRADGVGTMLSPSFQTPLGELPVALAEVQGLIDAADFISDLPDLAIDEHSMEVHLPFVAELFPKAKLLPVFFGLGCDRTMSERLGQILAAKYGDREDVMLIASSDMSHYFPYERAVEIDREAIKLVKALDAASLLDKMSRREAEFCGILPVLTLIAAQKALGGPEPVLVDYRNSGDTTAERSRVVGYSAIVFERPKENGSGGKLKKKGALNMEYRLTDTQKHRLLDIAKETVERFVKSGEKPDFDIDDPFLKEPGAAFVTLKKGDALRGCIGHTEARQPLWSCVRDMAVAASSQDPRFPPVSPEELNGLDLEISVLTPMVKVDSVDEIEVGRDGLMMERGYFRGLLLPQVPGEWGWSRDEFLSHTAMKAGLPADAWRDGSVTIYSFKAIVFDEKDLKGNMKLAD